MGEHTQPEAAAMTQLREAASRGTLSHALLLTGGETMAAAQFAAAAMECTAQGSRPCGVCPGCRKVAAGIHPDVMVVQDPEHKNLSMDTVRAVRSDAYIRPNEGARKVYLFPDCALLPPSGQNVLLKIVEEGPAYAAFLFCAENASVVLPTLRSRCVELKLPSEETAAPVSEAAEALCRALSSRRAGAVTEVLIRLERGKLSREALFALVEEVFALSAEALAQSAGKPAENGPPQAALLAKYLTKRQIIGTIELLQTIRRERRYNGNVGQTLGALAVELEGIL